MFYSTIEKDCFSISNRLLGKKNSKYFYTICTISWRLRWENIIKDQSIFPLVTILSILKSLNLADVRILLGENRCWSALGVRGLGSTFLSNRAPYALSTIKFYRKYRSKCIFSQLTFVQLSKLSENLAHHQYTWRPCWDKSFLVNRWCRTWNQRQLPLKLT